MPRPSTPLSAALPPLIMGTATFNNQYNHDPFALPTTELVQRAFTSGIRAFDTSPYYGPAEELLGRALATDYVRTQHPRSSYHILTKVGRIASSSFDYSPAWVRQSVRRSLQRLHTDYLDVVYCHDVEFVSRQEALAAIRELRRIRDTEGTIKYVGISGFPIDVLAEIAELVLRETGEPLDIVQSYANYTLQNTRLLSRGLPRFVGAGVDVVTNASPLGMGLLRRQGVPIGSMGDFHPAPDGLRNKIREVSDWVDGQGEKLEVVAIRFSLESWLREGKQVGALGAPLAKAGDADPGFISVASMGTGERLGVSVMGVSNFEELDETLRVWHSIVDGLENKDEDEDVEPKSSELQPPSAVPSAAQAPAILTPSEGIITDRAWSKDRRGRISSLAQHIRTILGPEWADYAWDSPSPDFVNSLSAEHLAARDKDAAAAATCANDESMVTPPLEAVDAAEKIPTAAALDVVL
ncbi:D-arabinose 1-dehydrogenase (NAD(P)(+)) ARA2 [Aspergillus luchuensis]|nr:uncharacterized protein AKAW2_20142S [Aspergillus luchuensis]BCR95202.1 hypothetical protein AKAW2_20142S [Aspergillus luchuensis]BCS07766.1 hypothetical protein ALUC_20137S [Aspergillus luchuensis]GAA89637.1 L-galactose dehydrogenase (L-GalDH) [Aspergillus luchuensis IFO 4308]